MLFPAIFSWRGRFSCGFAELSTACREKQIVFVTFELVSWKILIYHFRLLVKTSRSCSSSVGNLPLMMLPASGVTFELAKPERSCTELIRCHSLLLVHGHNSARP